jgi:hypothetical protein
MSKETIVHTVTVKGMSRADAFDKGVEEVLNSKEYENGDIRERPERGATEEISKPQKEKATYVKAESAPVYKRSYLVRMEGEEDQEAENVQEARSLAKELALGNQADVEIHLEYKLVEGETLYGGVTYQAAVEGEWTMNVLEDVEVEDEAEEKTGTDG